MEKDANRSLQNKRHLKRLQHILSEAVYGRTPTGHDIRFLLRLSEKEERQQLFSAACRLRQRYFDNKIFLYGFVYFSTYCRNNCRFCHFRRSNTALVRYRKTTPVILETVRSLVTAGVHLIDLTMGESPEFYNQGGNGFKRLADLVADVKRCSDLPVMISPGAAPDEVLADLAGAGADWYACYQETYNRNLFNRLRIGQDFDQRQAKKQTAKCCGMLIEEGILTGVGESVDDILQSIAMMRQSDADQVRVMTYVPQHGASFATATPPDPLRELMIIAVLRLVFPDRLIPASLDVNGLKGLKDRLDAGANVITSLVSPGEGWAGVANHKLDIEAARRTPRSVKPILKAQGLIMATVQEYQDWIDRRKAATDSKILL